MAINKTYEELVESAKQKLTTDDCYTPDNIYGVVRDYVAERYGLDPGTFVRPFYLGGDYQAEDYTGKVVVDNPPFSILRKIMNFYNENGIKWFLFTPGMSTVIERTTGRRCTSAWALPLPTRTAQRSGHLSPQIWNLPEFGRIPRC